MFDFIAEVIVGAMMFVVSLLGIETADTESVVSSITSSTAAMVAENSATTTEVAEATATTTATTSAEQSNAAFTPVTISLDQLSEQQRSLLASFGIANGIEITQARYACAVDAVGEERLLAYRQGELPSLREATQLVTCL